MADHVRTQLRNAVATRVTGLTTTAANVFGYRVHPLQVGSLPALVITTPQEDANPETIHAPMTVMRNVQVVVRGLARASADLDDTLDTIAKEVEAALGTAITIGARNYLLVYRGARMDYEDGEKPVGLIDLLFDVKLTNLATTPDVFGS